MSSMAKRSPFSRRTEEPIVLPPDLRKLGTLPFGPDERRELETWLGQAGWSRETMDSESLEGYLVALLIWPVDLPSGAWLPLIWGERGWKHPPKLTAPRDFERFVTLVCGLLQDLDRRLSDGTWLFIPALRLSAPRQRWRSQTPCRWASGFASALQQHAFGLKYRSMPARSAAEIMVRWSTLAPTTQTAVELSRAVRTLVMERPTRGPLGPLIPRQAIDWPGHAPGSITASVSASPSGRS